MVLTCETKRQKWLDHNIGRRWDIQDVHLRDSRRLLKWI